MEAGSFLVIGSLSRNKTKRHIYLFVGDQHRAAGVTRAVLEVDQLAVVINKLKILFSFGGSLLRRQMVAALYQLDHIFNIDEADLLCVFGKILILDRALDGTDLLDNTDIVQIENEASFILALLISCGIDAEDTEHAQRYRLHRGKRPSCDLAELVEHRAAQSLGDQLTK